MFQSLQIQIKNWSLIIALTSLGLMSCSTFPKKGYYQTGMASWYGPGFHGKTTANGEKYDQNKMTAAHRKLRFGTKVRVKSLTNGKQVVVRINDRGPYSKGRVIDLSFAAAKALGYIKKGVERVELSIVR